MHMKHFSILHSDKLPVLIFQIPFSTANDIKLKIGRERRILLLRRLGCCDLHLLSAWIGFAHEAKDRTALQIRK